MINSCYLRTTSLLRAKVTLVLPDSSRIRNFSQHEADSLADTMASKNPFVQKRMNRDFYYNRAKELGNRTVVEIPTSGSPSATINDAKNRADMIEKLAILASTLTVRRKEATKLLGYGIREHREFDLIFDTSFTQLRSRQHVAAKTVGIEIDGRFGNRFAKNGFDELYSFCSQQISLSHRLYTSASWLYESLVEPSQQAAVVKAAIALESLLIFSESEPLTRTLSERTAFLLSSDPRKRVEVANLVKRFYNVRSGIVHGSKRRLKGLSSGLLDGVTRLAVLLYLTISHNSSLLATNDALRKWCEAQRWSAPLRLSVPYRMTYLNNALSLANQ